jgi:hypothetical protein
MAGARFELIGIPGLTRALESLRDDVIAELADAVEDTAYAVQATAKTLVPRDRGDLARAIQLSGKGVIWRVGLADTHVPSRGGGAAHQHPWVYGIWYEYGFLTRNIPAQPFMQPAREREEPKHATRVEQALNKGLRD